MLLGRTKKPLVICNFDSNKKLGPEWAVNGLGKLFRKSDPKNRKNSKNQSEISACELKTTTEKPNFCSNTVFSLYFKIRVKNIHDAKPLAFSLRFLFWRDQNHHSNLTSKIMKMCEQILKKRQRHNTIQILWIVKAGQVLTYNSKNFHWLNKQLVLERKMSELGKPFLKNNQMKKKQKINVKMLLGRTKKNH